MNEKQNFCLFVNINSSYCQC